MKLSVSEVAQLLAAGEERVVDWIEDGSLPARRIRGEYRINRTELLEWATERQIALAPAAFCDPLSGSSFGSLSDALLAGGATHDETSTDAEQAMRRIIAALPLASEADRDSLLGFVLARESFGLAVVDGIAVPQVRTPVILPLRKGTPASLLTLTFLARPLELSASGATVDSIFFLVSPTVTTHLALLARLTASLKDERFRSGVKRRRTEVDLVDLAAEVEEMQ